MKRRLGLAALTCIELTPPQLVAAAAEAGYDCVGLRLIGIPGQRMPEFDQRELEQRLADTGVKVLDVEIFRLDPDVDLMAFEPALAVSAVGEALERAGSSARVTLTEQSRPGSWMEVRQ